MQRWDWSSCRRMAPISTFLLRTTELPTLCRESHIPWDLTPAPIVLGEGLEEGGAERLTRMPILLSTFIERGPWVRTVATSGNIQMEGHSLCSQGVYSIVKGNREHIGRALTGSCVRHPQPGPPAQVGVIGSGECWERRWGGAVLALWVAR